MDYIKEIINILENNEIRTIPSNELLASHPDIALAVWKNFVISGDYYGNYDFKEWYSEANWVEKLQPYKNDVKFWEKALDLITSNSNIDRNFILDLDFQKDFPIVKEKFLNDNNFVIDLYKKTGVISFLNVLNATQEEKNNLEKSYTLIHQKHASTDMVKFQDDAVFTKQILEKFPYLYTHLNDTNKLDDNYIQIALKYKYVSIKDIPEQKQNQFFPAWLEDNKDSIRLADLEALNPFQKKEVLKVKPEFIGQVLDKNIYAYQDIAVAAIEKDIFAIRHFNPQQLKKLFSEDNNYNRIKPQLVSYIQSYNNTQEISKTESKIFAFVNLSLELRKELKKNIFYALNTMPKEQKITINQFTDAFNDIKNQVENKGLTEGKADSFLVRMKNKLEPAELEIQKFPSLNLYQHLNTTEITVAPTKKLKM